MFIEFDFIWHEHELCDFIELLWFSLQVMNEFSVFFNNNLFSFTDDENYQIQNRHIKTQAKEEKE